MPDRTESDGGGNGGMKKRPQGVAKNLSFNGGSGYTTDESAVSGDGGRSNDKKRRARRSEGERDGGKASLIWMVLVIGLMFCMMDAAYIARVLDRSPTAEAESMELLSAERILEQLQQRQNGGNTDNKNNNPFTPQLLNNRGGNQQQQQRGFGRLTPEERRRRREEEEQIASEKRVKMIKLAALEALKAEHGGKLPDDMIDKALEDDEAFKPRPMSYYKEQAIQDDKTRIMDLFIEAGLKDMDDSTYKVLPSWSDVTDLYGKEARIVGLEQCDTFRNKGEPWEHFVSTAGTFNSGTNLMAEMLIHNCHMQSRMDKLGHQNRGIRWQVPWGKHTPPGDDEYRLQHKSKKDGNVDANMILPAVTVRDPYYWMQSMCKHHYTASWRNSDRCPNLAPDATDKANYPLLRDKDYFPLSVRYADFTRHHESLTGLWNDWYNEYKGVSFQRLFVRYEDLLFHPKEVAETVCKCAGGVMNKGKFQYVVDSAKKGIGAHGSVRTGYIDAIIKYGSERNRYNGYHPEDLAYARQHLDKAMMLDFGYKYHPMNLENNNDKADEGVGNGGNEHADEAEELVEHKEENEEPEVPEEEDADADKEEDAEEEVDADKNEEEPEGEKSPDEVVDQESGEEEVEKDTDEKEGDAASDENKGDSDADKEEGAEEGVAADDHQGGEEAEEDKSPDEDADKKSGEEEDDKEDNDDKKEDGDGGEEEEEEEEEEAAR